MKKIFTLIAVLTAAMSSMAADYTSQMSISLNGETPSSQEATVSAVRTEDGDRIFYEITLNQFNFSGIKIGDVTISGVEADDTDGMGGYSFFYETTKDAVITNGSAIAGMLGNKVTVTIKEGSCINDDNLYLDLSLPVAVMGQTIEVSATFGTKPDFPAEPEEPSPTAVDYTSQMSISLNGETPSTQEATVSAVRTEDGDRVFYEITLNQFNFSGIKIGDVTISGVEADDTDGMGGYSFFRETTKDAVITNGSAIAGMLGNKVTVTIKEGSCINDDNLYLDLSLPVAVMGQTIDVCATFGTKPDFPGTEPEEPSVYTDKLVVTAMGSTMPAQDATIIVTKQDNGKYTLALKNFELEGVMAVGTVEMTDVEGVEEDGIVRLATKQTVTITEGDDPDVTWALAGIPVEVDMTAEMTDSKLKADINILYSIPDVIDMDINVKFGDVPSGISTPVTAGGVDRIYDVNGNGISSMKKGINIIRKADGTTVKVIRK